jgi:hypothetical protein
MPRMIQHFADRGETTVLVAQPEPEGGAQPAGAIHGLGEQQLASLQPILVYHCKAALNHATAGNCTSLRCCIPGGVLAHMLCAAALALVLRLQLL